MQCKDIEELPILKFLFSYGGIGCSAWRQLDKTPFPRSVLFAMPQEIPQKLAAAKMKSLVNKGLVYGCCCGCRGDWELTEKGKELLKTLDTRRDVP